MFIDLLRKRRSIRRFTGHVVDRATLGLFAEALLRTPSSRDSKPWHFYFVTDTVLLQKLSRSKQHGTEFLAHAAFAIVIAGNERKSDVWIEDCSIAAIIVQLLATDLGLGSCWGQIRNRPHDATMNAETYVQHLLSIPQHERIGMIIGIGYPDEEPAEGVPVSMLDHDKIRWYPSGGTGV